MRMYNSAAGVLGKNFWGLYAKNKTCSDIHLFQLY